MTEADSSSSVRPLWFRVVRVLLIGGTTVVGVALVLLAFTVGDCSAFGGRCPREQPPILEDDTARLAGLGAALVVAPWVFLSRPSWRRLAIAVGAGAGAFVVVALMARSATSA
jgi:hypothetical protein